VRNLQENFLLSTLILGSIFSDYVVFYGNSSFFQPPDSATSTRIVFFKSNIFANVWRIHHQRWRQT